MGALKPEDDVNNDVVLNLDMHCAGCVKKLKKFLRNIHGVEGVKIDSGLNKLTVTGKLDPVKLRDTLAKKTNKNVELISLQSDKKPPPSAVEKHGDEAVEKPAPPTEKPKEAEVKEALNPKPEVKQSIVVLKTKLHCDGCIQKIRKIIARFKGVQDVEIDGAKDLVKVSGTMDLTELIPYLVEKLRRNVQLVPNDNKHSDADAGGGKKITSPVENAAVDSNAKKGDNVLEKKKEKESNGDGEVVKVEAQKMMMHQPNYSSYSYDHGAAGPSNWYYGGGGYGGHYYNHHHHQENGMMRWGEGYGGGRRVDEEGNVGYVVEHFQFQNHHHHHPTPPEPGMFSDENPNGCSVM